MGMMGMMGMMGSMGLMGVLGNGKKVAFCFAFYLI